MTQILIDSHCLRYSRASKYTVLITKLSCTVVANDDKIIIKIEFPIFCPIFVNTRTVFVLLHEDHREKTTTSVCSLVFRFSCYFLAERIYVFVLNDLMIQYHHGAILTIDECDR